MMKFPFLLSVVSLAVGTFSGSVAAQDDVYTLISRTTDGPVVSQTSLAVNVESGRSLATSDTETGLFVLGNDTSLTLAPGSEFVIRSIERNARGDAIRLELEAQTGTLRFDVSDSADAVVVQYGERTVTLTKGSGLIKVGESGQLLVGLIHGGPLTIRFGESPDDSISLAAGEYVELAAEVIEPPQPYAISETDIEEEYRSFNPAVLVAVAESVEDDSSLPVAESPPITTTEDPPIATPSFGGIGAGDLLGSGGTADDQVNPQVGRSTNVDTSEQVPLFTNSNGVIIRFPVGESGSSESAMASAMSYDVLNNDSLEPNPPELSGGFNVAAFTFSDDVTNAIAAHNFGSDPIGVPDLQTDINEREARLSLVVYDSTDEQNSDIDIAYTGEQYALSLLVRPQGSVDVSEMGHDSNVRIGCVVFKENNPDYCNSSEEGSPLGDRIGIVNPVEQENDVIAYIALGSRFDILYTGVTAASKPSDENEGGPNLRPSVDSSLDSFFALQDYGAGTFFAIGSVDNRAPLDTFRLDNYTLSAGLADSVVRGFIREQAFEISSPQASFLDTGLLALTTENDRSSVVHADIGFAVEGDKQTSTFSITLGDIDYASTSVDASLFTLGSSLLNGSKSPVAITSDFVSTAFGGGDTLVQQGNDGYASYLVLQNYTANSSGTGVDAISGGVETLIGGGSASKTYSTVRLASLSSSSTANIDASVDAKDLQGWVGGFAHDGGNITALRNLSETVDGGEIDSASLDITISDSRAVTASLTVDGAVSDLSGESARSFYQSSDRFAVGNEDLALITADLLLSDGDAASLSGYLPIASDGQVSTYEHLQWGFFLGDINPDQDATAHVHMGSWVAGVITPDGFFDAVQQANLGAATFSGHMVGNVYNDGSQYTASGTYQNDWTFEENGKGSGVLTLNFDDAEYQGEATGQHASFSGRFEQNEGNRVGELDGNFFGQKADAQGGMFLISEEGTESPGYGASGTFAAECTANCAQ